MKIINIKYIGIAILMGIFSLTSCNIKEDMSNCPGSFLLDYTAYSDEILDDIDPESVVNIYVFDAENVCSEIIKYTYGELEANNFEFEVPMKYFDRYVQVWQGNDADEYNAQNMKVGQSIEDFYLNLNINVDHSLNHAPAPLWASMLEKVEFCASISRHRIFMTRIHTEVNVAVDIVDKDGSTTSADMNDFLINIEAIADKYHKDFTLCNECEEVLYNNSEEIAAHNANVFGHAGTLRLTPDHLAELYVTDTQSGENITIGSSDRMNLVDYMLQSRTKAAPEEITDQRYLDLNKVWDVKLSVKAKDPEIPGDTGYAAISLTINGWTTWFNDADLD